MKIILKINKPYNETSGYTDKAIDNIIDVADDILYLGQLLKRPEIEFKDVVWYGRLELHPQKPEWYRS